MTTGVCPVCGSSSQPLESNQERYGYVAFHARCEAKMVADRLVAEMEETYRAEHLPPDRYETMRFNGFSWVDDDGDSYP